MKYSVACLIAITLTAGSLTAQEQMPALQQGIRVQMAMTSNANAFPDADRLDAWVVTVAADGRLFFGVKPLTPGEFEEMKATPRHRDQNLYVKADARTSFANVETALKGAKIVWFNSAVLLTNQNESASVGTVLPPKGLEVLLTSPRSDAVVVQVRNSGQVIPTVAVNGQEVSLSDLQNMLNRALENRGDRTVWLQADDSLNFGQVAQVIDACGSVKAKVAIATE